jgi:hypothetical protein
MYTNTVFSAVFRAVPGLTTPISCPSFSITRHFSVLEGPSSGVYVGVNCHTAGTLRTVGHNVEIFS